MEKKRIRENSPAPEKRAPATPGERNDGAGGDYPEQLAAGNGVELPQSNANAQPLPRNYQELGGGIFARHHPVDVGCQVLEKSEDRGAATKLRALETYAAWAFGKPDAEGNRKPPRIIWDIPGPPYEPVDPEQEKLEGGEK